MTRVPPIVPACVGVGQMHAPREVGGVVPEDPSEGENLTQEYRDKAAKMTGGIVCVCSCGER